MPRRENRKIRHENEILKVNEPTHVQIYQITPKTYHTVLYYPFNVLVSC
jgi:hypothetical protein